MTFLSVGVEEEGARVVCEVGREKLREAVAGRKMGDDGKLFLTRQRGP